MILDYRFSLWNFQPTQQVTDDGSAVATFSDTRTANEQPAAVGGGIRLATFNVENYFPMTGEDYVAAGPRHLHLLHRPARATGSRSTPAPAPTAAPARAAPPTTPTSPASRTKIVTGINRLGASIVSLEEIENSAKFGEPRDTALAGLVDALNAAAGSNVWAYVPSPSAAKLPPLADQDVIRTALHLQAGRRHAGRPVDRADRRLRPGPAVLDRP